MSEFYRVIKEYYDDIFKLNLNQIEFVKKKCQSGSTLLEVGCANGKLTNALSAYFNVIGVDVEDELIEIARNRYSGIDFRTLSLINIDNLEEEFDNILCFGNTLVHVNEMNVEEFLIKAYKKIKAGGRLLIQIVNYGNYSLKDSIKLPVIDNEVIRFERYYERNDKFIFKADLKIKKDKLVLHSEVELYPITKNELVRKIKSKGFTTVEFYGYFAESEFTENSNALVICAIK